MVHCSTLGTCSRYVFWFAGRILAFQEAQPPLDFRFQMISGSWLPSLVNWVISTSKPCFLKAHHPFEVFLSLELISDTRLSVTLAFHKIWCCVVGFSSGFPPIDPSYGITMSTLYSSSGYNKEHGRFVLHAIPARDSNELHLQFLQCLQFSIPAILHLKQFETTIIELDPKDLDLKF